MGNVIEIQHLYKSFGEVKAVQDLSFRVKEGELFAFLGVNGAGKSTTINILCGQLRKDGGSVKINGFEPTENPEKVKRALGVVFQNSVLDKALTVYENLESRAALYGIHGRAFKDRLQELSGMLGFGDLLRRTVGKLSGGQRRRIDIARALLHRPDILILDEPSAVLTAQEAKEMFHVLRRMADSGKSVVVISHKMNEVMEFADRITVLKGGEVEDTMPASEATVERLTKAVVGERELKPHKNEGGTKREEVVLEVKDLTVKNDRELEAIKKVSFDIHAGEIFVIAGVAGNGQKELAEAVTGLRKAIGGTITISGEDVTTQGAKARVKKRVGFIPEDRLSMGLVPGMNMEENRILKEYDTPRFSKNHILKKKVIHDTVQDEINRYAIKTAGDKSPVSLMSGGNQQKLLVAREIGGDPVLLVAVYPSRGLDMGAAEAIHEILLEQCKKGVAVLLISEELDELFQMSDRIGVLCSGEMMAVLDRNEADYDTIGRLMSGERYEK